MVRVNENVDAIALYHGEADARQRLELDLGTVLGAMRRIYTAQINLSWVTDTYGWITVVAPILVASPVYFSGDISFGGLMMAVGAFNQVHSSLRWFINNIGSIADWRATLMRVADFRIALDETDVLHDSERRITFDQNGNGSLTFEKLQVASPEGCTKLSDQHVEIHPGERVMITGEPGAGKTLFFRAIAGLWPWGSGRIGLPAGETLIFVPRVPYLPAGTLREVLNHANGHAPASDADIAAVLAEVGLERLSSSLDRVGRWDHELGDDEQRLLGVAGLAAAAEMGDHRRSDGRFRRTRAAPRAGDAGKASEGSRDHQYRARPAQHSVLSARFDDREGSRRAGAETSPRQGRRHRSAAGCRPPQEIGCFLWLRGQNLISP